MNLLQINNYETKRVAELSKYNILDTPAEKEYEEIAFLASVICQAPIAALSFLEENRQWFKACVGVTLTETEKMHSFCQHAVMNPDEIMVVEDARKDSRFQDNPFVTGGPKIVFYAGIPLFNRQGYGLGTLCVLDHQPRTLHDRQARALKILSIQVMHLLELRRINHEQKMLKLLPGAHHKNFDQFAGVLSQAIQQPEGISQAARRLLDNLSKESKN